MEFQVTILTTSLFSTIITIGYNGNTQYLHKISDDNSKHEFLNLILLVSERRTHYE